MEVMETLVAAAEGLCRLMGADSGVAVRAACAAMAALLVALIALGFGPLRGWLWAGPARPAGRRESVHGARAGAGALHGYGHTGPVGEGQFDGGLLATWRLYRQLRRASDAAGPAGAGAGRLT